MTEDDLFNPNARMCPLERLLNKTVRISSGCLLYTGKLDKYGYGQFTINSRKLGAHKVAYILSVGEVPEGKVLLHSCDTPNCVEVTHLSIGTPKDNVQDCIQKQRFKFLPNKPKPRRIIIGYNENEMLVFTDVYALMKAGFHDGSVSHCANGTRKTHRNYSWYYDIRR